MTMKSLKVNHYPLPQLPLSEIPAWLDGCHEEFQPIATVNWPEFPYQPRTAFRIVATPAGFVLNFRVQEQSVAAVAAGDGGHVWEDSCVEFFSSPADDGIYYNIECNCVGTVLVAAGKDRHARTPAPQEVLQQIQRWSSLGRENFDERIGDVEWQVVLLIPYATWFQHHIGDVRGMDLRANFYKCGDKLRTPHFLSWNAIGVAQPDFHRPDFFGTLHL